MDYLLTIAGHDPVHGAGITADLAAWATMGLDGASVVTALTVQNAAGVQRVEPVASSLVRDALQAVLHQGEPLAIKVGMTGSVEVLDVVAGFLAERRCPVVFDPVLAASNGLRAHDGEEEAFLAAVRRVMARSHVVTPNLPEARRLLGRDGGDLRALRALTGGTVVLKGGHDEGEAAVDWVHDGERTASLSAPRRAAAAHGTGCLFAAVMAGMLARGWDVFEAATEAKLRVLAGIDHARTAGDGRPHVNTAAVADSRHLPAFHWHADASVASAPCDIRGQAAGFLPLPEPVGFYPVVPDAGWVERLLGWGVRTVQLRAKAGTVTDAVLRAEVRRAVEAGRAHGNAQVFINDHWQLAIECGAFGVHLGQEDLDDDAALVALRAAGVRLGISTHTPAELARAHGVAPSYVAIGPVYPTTLKAMRYDPVGLDRLKTWTQRAQPRYPVVAIGGIDLQRAPGVWACGVDGLAVVSAVTQAADPEAVVRAFGVGRAGSRFI